MELKANVPSGPIAEKWSKHRFDMKLVNPANKRKYSVIVVGSGLAGGAAAASLAELGYNVKVLLLPGQPAPRPLDRGPGRDQRGQELPERRRQRLPPLLRHGEGRRLPRPRGERLPPGRAVGEHHRPVRGPGRALRPRVRRHPRQPLVRRRPGLAHVLRARPDRPAAAARRLPGPDAAGRRRAGEDALAPRDARARRDRRPGPRHRGPRHGHREARDPPRRRGGARHRRLRQRLLPRHLRQGLQRHRDLARLQEGRGLRQPLLHPDPPHLHPRPRRLPEQAHAHERVAPQRRPHLGAEEGGRQPPAAPDPRGRARLLPRAEVPDLRQPRPPRHLLPRGQAGLRRGPRRGPGRPRRLPRLRRLDPAARGGEDRREVRQPLRDVRADHRRGPLQGPDAHLPGLALHDGRALGGLQPHEHDPRAPRGRRGELLRPRRQPPRGLRPDAGPRRRLLHPPLHRRPLPRLDEAREGGREPPRGEGGGGRGRGAHAAAPLHEGQAHGRRPSTASSARSCGSTAAWAATRPGLEAGAPEDPRAARGVLAEPERPGQRRRPQPVARDGRPRGRLPRARRAHVPGRPRARGVLRRPLPRGVPDRRTARRCATTSASATWRPGSTPARARSRYATSSPWPSRTCHLQTRSYK